MRLAAFLLAAAMLAGITSPFVPAIVAPAHAQDYTAGEIVLSDPWTRATPPGARTGGGFVTIANTGDTADRLVSASSPVAKHTEIHTMSMDDGVMRMRHLPDGIEIPAGETVALKPGSLHIMFIDLEQPIEMGTPVPVVLTFEKAGAVDVEMTVAPPGAPGPKGKAGHKAHGDQ